MELKHLARKLRQAADILDDLLGADRPTAAESLPGAAATVREAISQLRERRKKPTVHPSRLLHTDKNPVTGLPYQKSFRVREKMRLAQLKRYEKARAVRNLIAERNGKTEIVHPANGAAAGHPAAVAGANGKGERRRALARARVQRHRASRRKEKAVA